MDRFLKGEDVQVKSRPDQQIMKSEGFEDFILSGVQSLGCMQLAFQYLMQINQVECFPVNGELYFAYEQFY
jgi:hypothetical protein